MWPPPANTPSAVGAFTCSDKPSIFFLIFLKKYIAYGSRSEEVSQAEPLTNLPNPAIYPIIQPSHLSNPARATARVARTIHVYRVKHVISIVRATLAVALAGIQASIQVVALAGIQASIQVVALVSIRQAFRRAFREASWQ